MNTLIQSPSTVRFPVANVKPATERLPETTLRAVCERMIRTRLLVCPAAEQKVVEPGNFHSLIAATALAYQFHYPLVLSPDMIWLTVLQGVAQHIKNHAEKLRERLVHHQTKIELVVDPGVASLPKSEEEMLHVGKLFATQIARHVKPDKQGLFQAEFTTTTDNERIAGHIVLMDTFEPYFDYVCMIICGIPSVILEGTPDDWDLLGAKVRALHDSDLELSWWTQHLLPLCEQFARASRGDVDCGHWNNLCKLVERYGANDLNGWMLKFIPYLKSGDNQPLNLSNPVLSLSVCEEAEDETKDMGKVTGCTPDMLPSGISQAPVTFINIATSERTRVEFIGGFFGVRQSETDLSLRPVIAWGISETRLIDQVIARMQVKDEAAAEKELEAGRPVWVRLSDQSGANQSDAARRDRQLWEKFNDYVPADIVRFYNETDGASYKGPKNPSISIFNLQKVEPAWEKEAVLGELEQLLQQGHISKAVFEERVEFNAKYSGLACFASDDATGNFFVFGRDPEEGDYPHKKKSRGEVFRWNVGDFGRQDGEGRTREAFIPVAMTFAEWLANILDEIEADTSNQADPKQKA